MDANTAKKIIDDDALTDNDISVLLDRAKKKAVNQHFWKSDDIPTEPMLEVFYARYEFEIYDIAKAIYSNDSRDGLKAYSELGVSRTWGETGKETVDKAVAAIPPKTYVCC